MSSAPGTSRSRRWIHGGRSATRTPHTELSDSWSMSNSPRPAHSDTSIDPTQHHDAALDRVGAVDDLGADHGHVRERGVDQVAAELVVVTQQQPQRGDEGQQQREQREEPLVGQQHRELPAPVLAVALDHAMSHRQRRYMALRCIDPVHDPIEHVRGRGGVGHDRTVPVAGRRSAAGSGLPGQGCRVSSARGRPRVRRPDAGTPRSRAAGSWPSVWRAPPPSDRGHGARASSAMCSPPRWCAGHQLEELGVGLRAAHLAELRHLLRRRPCPASASSDVGMSIQTIASRSVEPVSNPQSSSSAVMYADLPLLGRRSTPVRSGSPPGPRALRDTEQPRAESPARGARSCRA